MQQRHIAIIGGGITGVTSAYTLAQAGYRVTLIEKNRYAGMETSTLMAVSCRHPTPRSGPPSTLIKGPEVDVHQGRAAADEPHTDLAQAELDGRVCGGYSPLP
jgi:glycine/D-amino acid oxidase-like deaminating enzyme